MADDANALSSLLTDFGIDYPNAPAPTPALLAFMRGLGMNLGQSEDVRRQGLANISSKIATANESINRSYDRAKQNTTADLIRRGVLSSGEANTRYARQDEDVAAKRAEVEQNRTEATQAVENAYEQARGTYRQQALERVLSTEEQQATQKATQEAQDLSWKRQEEASQKAYDQQKAAQDAALAKQEEWIKQYASQGVLV